MSIDDYRAKQTAATDALVAVLREIDAGGGDGGGGETEPPPPSNDFAKLTSGLQVRRSWSTNWKGSGWYFYRGWDQYGKGGPGPNNEQGYNLPENAYEAPENSCRNRQMLRLKVARQNAGGMNFTQAIGEAYGFFVGAGKPFAVDIRMRWQGYPGFWGGPWLYELSSTPNEIDIMETINLEAPWRTCHSPAVPTGAYAAANDGGWHNYTMRVDHDGMTFGFDNRIVPALTVGAAVAREFVQAQMFLKLQHLVGGDWPRQMPPASFTEAFLDVDYIDVWQP